MNDLVETAEQDPFAEAAAEKPDCKFARVIDKGLGVEFVIAFAPGSRYFDVVQDRQTMHIGRTDVRPTVENLKRIAAA